MSNYGRLIFLTLERGPLGSCKHIAGLCKILLKQGMLDPVSLA